MNSVLTQAVSNSASEPVESRNKSRFAGKRVAMVTFSPYPYDPRPRRAIDALMSEGAEIDLICLAEEGKPLRESLPNLNIQRIPLKHDRRGKFQYAYRYGAFIFLSAATFGLRALARRYDVVYVHNMPDVLVASALVPKALGAKVVLDLHDPMPELMTTIFQVPEESKSVRLLKKAEKWSIGRSNLTITVNIACQRIFSNRSCRLEKIAVVMNSPDDRIFRFQPASTSLRTPDSPFVIMYHGSLVERNGLNLAIEALARVRSLIPQVELRVYGGRTDFLDSAMELAKERGIQDSVRYLGPRRLEDLVTEIMKCDLGVIPNQRNAFTDINTPTRIFEYLALGKPVIAPSTLGITDYFGKDALLFFESGDAQDLARQIEYAWSHPAELSQIAQKAQQVYLDHTWERERETLLSRISGILQA
jgi:glycosyltransferase involved in cell wall biosynthesis